jgi:hypothetical protein
MERPNYQQDQNAFLHLHNPSWAEPDPFAHLSHSFSPITPTFCHLQQVTVLGIQITHFSLFVLRQPYVPDALVPLSVRQTAHGKVRAATECTKAHEADTD